MAVLKGSFNLDGRWSEVQVRKLVETYGEAAAASGLRLSPIDITTNNDSTRWYIFTVRCLKHDVVVRPDSACDMCLLEDP